MGSVGQYSGPIGAVFLPGLRAVQAWVAATNNLGGVACHPIQLIAKDDGGDPARHQALVKQFVETEGVVAFVFMAAPLTGRASVAYLNSKRVPVVGTDTSEDWVYDSPMYFPAASSGDTHWLGTAAAIGNFARSNGTRKLGTIACVESEVCSRVAAVVGDKAPDFGMELVYQSKASITQPDYIANCQAAKSAGTEMYGVFLDTASFERLARSCDRLNWRPTYVTTSLIQADRMTSNPSLDGTFLELNVQPWMQIDHPGIAEYRETLKQQSPDLPYQANTIAGWVTGKLLGKALAKLPERPTSESVLEGLWSIKNDDLGGLTQPLTFTRDQKPVRVTCFWQVQLRGGRWTSPDGGQRTCI